MDGVTGSGTGCRPGPIGLGPLGVALLIGLGCQGSPPIDRSAPPSPPGSAPGRPPSSPGSTAGTNPAPPGSAAAPGVLEIRSVSVPVDPAGLIPLQVTLASARGLPIRLQVSLSIDGGQSFRPARVAGALSNLTPAPQGSEHQVNWSSLDDLGFRTPRAARLLLVASDDKGDSAPLEVDFPRIDNLRAASRRVQSYLIHYGSFDPAAVALAKQHHLVIIHPTAANLQRPLIAELQQGRDAADPGDDVIVMCYLSVGEDERVFGKTDAQAALDPRFRGDGSGPRIDPRGPNQPQGMPLGMIDSAGRPSNGGVGWASYYLDDNSVQRSPTGVGDGIPDRNALFGGFFVNAGDPKWFDVLQSNRMEVDRVAGARELLTTSYGRGLGCDGLFMDTLDTVSPNFNTDLGSANLARFEWTAAGMSGLVARLRQSYPDRLLLQNRGLFYFDPRLPHYQLTTRGNIDFLLFESYRLGSQPTPADFHRDNRFNVAPKLMAEANRPDGFTVLSLGYPEGTGLAGSVDTLTGRSMVGLQSLLEDIDVAQNLTGFRHYMTNAQISLVNSFVRDHSDFSDSAPPRFTSTFNDRLRDPMLGPQEPTARVGIQQVVPVAGGLTVRWDVALDLHRVRYALYYQDRPFDFAADPRLTRATRHLLTPGIPQAYGQRLVPDALPFEETIRPLPATSMHYLVIRAFDESPAGNEDSNTVVLSATPAPP